jgi:hypothetical protein
MLTTHLHLVPKSRMHRAVPSRSQYAFKAWCSAKSTRSTLPLHILSYLSHCRKVCRLSLRYDRVLQSSDETTNLSIPTSCPMSTRLKWLGREVERSSQSYVEVKNTWRSTFISYLHGVVLKLSKGHFFMAWYLVKHKNIFTCTMLHIGLESPEVVV